jgi:PAS domain S-box-containing protein
MAEVERFVPELDRHFLCRSIPVPDETGRVSLLVEQLHDLTERKRVERGIRESEANFRLFFESMTDIMVVATPEGRILFTNRAARDKLGYREDELAAMHLLDWHRPEDRGEAEGLFTDMLAGRAEHCALPLVAKDGTVIPVETRVWFGKWSLQECVFGTCKDLTVQQEAQQRFERIFRSSPSPMALSSLPDRRFVDVNDAFLETAGYTREEVIGRSSAELGLTADARTEDAIDEILRAEGRIVNHELQVRRKDGSLRDGLFSGEVVRSQGRESFLTVMADITALKRAEVQLRLQSLVLDQIQDRVTVTDLDGIITYVNDAEVRSLGYSREELIGFPTDKYGDDPERGATQREIVESTLANGSWRGEVVNHTRDGREVILDCRTQVVVDQQGHRVALAGIATDVTDRRRMELELRERENRLALALETARIGYWKWHLDTNRVEWFGDHHKLFGIRHEDFEGTIDHVQRCVHPDDREMGIRNMERAADQGEPFDNTYRVVHPDGSVHWLNSFGHITDGGAGGAGSMFGITRDVSEHKFALETVGERLAQLTALLECMQCGVLVEDTGRHVLFANRDFCDLFGIPSTDACIGMDCRDAARASAGLFADPQGFLSGIETCIAGATPVLNQRFDTVDGRILERTYAPVLMGERSFGHLWVYRDKTEQITAEQEVVRAREEWERTFRAVPDLICIIDPEHRILRANRAFAERLGAAPEELAGRSCFEVVHGLDAPPGFCPHSRTLLDGKEHSVDTSGTNLGGDLQVTTNPLHRPDGSLLGSVHVARDVTEQKALEKQLRQAVDYTRRVLDSSDAHMAVVGADGVILDINAAWRDFALANGAGSEDEWGVGARYERPAPAAAGSDDQTRKAYDGLRAVQRGELPSFEFEYPFSCPTGDYWFTMRVLPLRNAPGSVLVSHINITDRMLAQDALAKSVARNSAILSAIPDILFVIRRDGAFLDCCASDTGALLYEPADIVGKRIEDLLPPDLAELTRRNLERTLGQRCPSLYDYTLYFRGEDRQYEARMVPSGPDEALAIVRDITALVSAQNERIEMEKRFQHAQKLESLGILAGGIAHDFNNLLMSILGHADLALDQLSPTSPARKNIEQIETASRRAADLCAQMLAYSGRGRFIIETFDVSALLEEMVHLLKASVSKKAALSLHTDATLPGVRGDATQIRQVVMNLVINASEAIGDAAGVIDVSTGTCRCSATDLRDARSVGEPADGVYVCIEVRDTGCGMDEATLDRLFDPFFTTKFAGRGLGMAAVLGIVQGHNGVLTVDSRTGAGSRFRVLLPAAESDQVPEPATDREVPAAKPGGRVLLVDDEDTIRELGQQMLECIGLEVVTASDGREALSVYERERDAIDLVLLDLTMPHMDGGETLHELRRIDPDVRVVMSSGYSTHEMEARFADRGLLGIIQKPYSLAELRQRLYPLMGRGKPHA